MQAAATGHQLMTGAQIEVVSVAEDDGRADGQQIVRGQGLDRAHRTHRHEDGGRHRAVGRVQQARTGRAVRVFQGKGGVRHGTKVAAKAGAWQGLLLVPVGQWG